MTASNFAIKKSGSSPFRARARLIRLLGEELISDEVMAVVELVKNSYDADACRVTVTLEKVTDQENGLIRIEDDGFGMDLQTVLYDWLEPATNHKRARGGIKTRTPRGRIQLGEKGVGRFAADKLGGELELVTRKAGVEEETVVKVGWQHFEHDHYLDEVENNWFTREPVEFAGSRHGTLLLIRKLRTGWTEAVVKRVYNGLLRLVSPTVTNMDFVIEVKSEEFPMISGRVMNPLLDTAPYRLTGKVDGQGILKVTDGKDNFVDLRQECQGYFRKGSGEMRNPECGPFSISLNVWDLEPVNKTGTGMARATREAVRSFSGVSIYRDGFRVWPYGERDDDWLELNQRRVNNPTLRVSNNQVIGYLEITDRDNPELRDRTSREGLIENIALADLRVLVMTTLAVLETKRFKRRHPEVERKTGVAPQEEDELLQLITRARKAGSGDKHNTGLKATLYEMEQFYRNRLQEERKRYNQVSRLAGTGMAAELLTDAFSRDISNVTKTLSILENVTRYNGDLEIRKLVKELTNRFEAVNEKLDLMGPLYQPNPSENEPVNVIRVIADVVTILDNRIQETGTRVMTLIPRNMEIRISEGHLMQVLMILVENALRVIKEAATPEPCIEIKLVSETGFKGLLVSDNGPGVPEPVRSLIFQPYFSARQAGRGLGLHVARDILEMYNSSVDLVFGKSSLPGACFEMKFDRRRVI